MTSKTKPVSIPKLRFPGFSGSWEERNLGSFTKIYDGTHQTPHYVSEGVPFYSVEHLTANQFENTKYISEEVFIHEQERASIEKGDILMTRIGDIGTAKLIDRDVRASFYVSLALIKKSDSLYSSFLSHYIHSSFFQKELWRRTIHVAFPKKINLGEISKCLLNIPSLPEQTKIADFLSSVDEKVTQLTDLKSVREQYKKGMMQKIFSQEIRFRDENGNSFPVWEEKKLGEVAQIQTGNLNVQDAMTDGEFVFFDRSEEIKKFHTYSFDNEAIIYAGEGSKFLPRYFHGKYGLHQRSYTVFNVKSMDMKYLYYFMLTQNNHFLRMAVGSTVKSLRMDCFEKCVIKVPSLYEQEKIAGILSEIDTKINQIDEQIDNATVWKKGLLQGLFI